MLIALGMIIGFYVPYKNKFSFILEVLGTVGLILIVLDALGLKLLKNKVFIIFKSFWVKSVVTLGNLLFRGVVFK